MTEINSHTQKMTEHWGCGGEEAKFLSFARMSYDGMWVCSLKEIRVSVSNHVLTSPPNSRIRLFHFALFASSIIVRRH